MESCTVDSNPKVLGNHFYGIKKEFKSKKKTLRFHSGSLSWNNL